MKWYHHICVLGLIVAAFCNNQMIRHIGQLVAILFGTNWKLIFQVTFLGYDPNTGKKKHPFADIAEDYAYRRRKTK